MRLVWHDGPLDALVSDGAAPVAWSVAEAFSDGGNGPARRRALAARLIGRLASVPPEAVSLTRTSAGAPVVTAPSGWHISLSSRAAHCLIGVSRRPIGVDREMLEDGPPLWDMLTDAEVQALRSLPFDRQSREWLRRWTMKEAHAKLIGEPRRIAPEAIDTEVVDMAMGTASFEGRSCCRTREIGGAIETVAQWENDR